MELLKDKSEVAYFMRRLYQMGLTTTSGGNISTKTSDNKVLITPSKLDKARLQQHQIAVMDMDGQNYTPQLTPSIETNLHLFIYKAIPEIQAIIHAHPIMATTFTAMNKNINTSLIAEARAIVGNPITAPYAVMGSDNLAELVSNAAIKSPTVLMENHGVLTTGNNLLEAFDRLEVLECAAKMTYYTELMYDKKELSPDAIRELDQLFPK